MHSDMMVFVHTDNVNNYDDDYNDDDYDDDDYDDDDDVTCKEGVRTVMFRSTFLILVSFN